MIIEVMLDGRGAVRIETSDRTNDNVKDFVTHAVTELLRGSGPKAKPIGFSAGSTLDTEVAHDVPVPADEP